MSFLGFSIYEIVVFVLQEEKRSLQDRLAQQQRLLSQTDQEKREMERNNIKNEKEKKMLKATIDRVSTNPKL